MLCGDPTHWVASCPLIPAETRTAAAASKAARLTTSRPTSQMPTMYPRRGRGVVPAMVVDMENPTTATEEGTDPAQETAPDEQEGSA